MTLSHDPPRVNSTLTQKKIVYNESLLYLPGTDCPLRSQASLASLTSFRVGGPAEWYVAPQRLEDLQASFEWGHSQGLPLTLLGAGSNLLISDRGLPGLVICTRHLRHTQFDEETGTVTAGAGEPIARLAWQAAERGWEGLEWAVGIPGTVGGAVVMNAGAHKSCTADILVNVQTLSPTGFMEELTPQDLGFQYRTSNLQGGDRLVVEATFQLKPGADPVQVRAATSQHLEQRRRSQPYHLPSCGSVFRNPDTRPAAWLIEQLGLKGYTIGRAQVAERHANFILNCGGAQASDIFQIIRHIQQQVEQHWSVWLEPEVKILGEFQPA
ncbi:UDP-N-acetylmuramate dehydrogenase [Allocoleopsis franciscana]|uniref:UDP-N-acetylenolpyruvoylglucosamine reductase n=1 Tax=Allocoleopsis franciscana PCC 7113 TaxID=1173027 RepID=K9WDR9_9CYAN|nr:UDP-N-acetylmuramate dehydrogenase [Allocoleopsis franciscana]AFZ17904.1 UDP-N-acetylmuramate dehydrogenase [Allocoleopsis franciscana PCC 7113]